MRYVHDLPAGAQQGDIDQARFEQLHDLGDKLKVWVTYGTTVSGTFQPDSLVSERKKLEIYPLTDFGAKDSIITTLPSKRKDTRMKAAESIAQHFDEEDMWHTI
jgi:hypothetical protein